MNEPKIVTADGVIYWAAKLGDRMMLRSSRNGTEWNADYFDRANALALRDALTAALEER